MALVAFLSSFVRLIELINRIFFFIHLRYLIPFILSKYPTLFCTCINIVV